MKRLRGIVALVLSLCLLSPLAAFPADTVKGTIKKVDAKASTVTFSREGTKEEEVLPVDKSVNLRKIKWLSKARLEIEGGVVKAIEVEKTPAAGY